MRHLRREGVTAGRHRIRRLMAVMGMEATYRRPRTSVANSEHRIFPYLLRDLEISRTDHVWCADITYIPVTQGFFYLVAVMDWATRHVLSWRLSNTMDASFCIGALDDALVRATPEILNTDQGSQFTSEAFADRVLGAGVAFSMDGRGRFLDNIFIERLWRSLKYEAVYLHELRDGVEAGPDHRLVDRLLQRGAPALVAGRADARRDLPQRRGGDVNDGSLSGLTDALARQRGAGDLPVLHVSRRRRPKPRSPVGFPLPASGAHPGIRPSPCGRGPQTVESLSRQNRAKAPEGSQNQSESTLALPSDCPTK